MDKFYVQRTWPSIPGLEITCGTNTIKCVFHKEKSKDIRATYVRAVCDIQPQKQIPKEQDSQEEVI